MASRRLTRCDYLVLTYRYTEREQAIYPNIFSKVADGRDIRIRGYIGKQQDKVFVGDNGDRVLVQATGSSAHEVLSWRYWLQADDLSVARFDAQITIKCADPDNVIIGTRPSKLYKATLIYGLNHEGATLYVGAPTSRMRVRIYNKTAESGITADDGSRLLRVECQWRDEYADRALRYYAGGELDQYFMFHIRKIGDAYIHNLVAAALEYPDGRVVELEDLEDDWVGRRLNWLEQSVRPAIQRLAAADYYSALAWIESVKRVIIEQAAENDSGERS